MTPELNKIYPGDALTIMRSWRDSFINTCVTSPPYWGLRDYGTAAWEGGSSACDHSRRTSEKVDTSTLQSSSNNANHEREGWKGGVCGKCGVTKTDGQLGLEKTPQDFVSKMVEIFREVRRVLRPDGTLWLNLGDSYSGSGKRAWDNKDGGQKEVCIPDSDSPQTKIQKIPCGLKAKDLIGIPWRVAFALQADGWYLRSDIIWHKPNPMPESVTDRPTKSHEYLFLMTKSERYHYDSDAIKEPAIYRIDERPFGDAGGNRHGDEGRLYKPPYSTGKHDGDKNARYKPLPDGQARIRIVRDKQRGHPRPQEGNLDVGTKQEQCSMMRNKRSVWTIATSPFREAHFATFPMELIKPCILAGSMGGGIVLDPFMGAGTTALAATEYGRNFLGCELNPEYVAMAELRIANEKAQVKMAL